MPISPELRARVTLLSKTMGRNAIERALGGALSRPSITKILRENSEEKAKCPIITSDIPGSSGNRSSTIAESSGNPIENDKLPPGNLPAQAEGTGNISIDKTVRDVVKDNNSVSLASDQNVRNGGNDGPGSTSTSEENEGDDENLPFPNAMKSDSKYEVDSFQQSPLLLPIPLAVPIQAQTTDIPLGVQPVTPTTVKPAITITRQPSSLAEPEPEMEFDNSYMIHWALELKQRKKDLDTREKRIHRLESEYRNVIPMAKALVEMGIEPDQVVILQEAIMYLAEIEQIDTTEAAQKILGMLKRTIDVGKVVRYIY